MKGKILTILIFAAIITSSFYFGFSRLKNFSGVDEPYWSYGRVPTFWKSIKNRKWKSTNICDKPGITLAMISGAGLPFIDGTPKDYKKLRYEPKTVEQMETIREIYRKLRTPVFLFTLAMLPVFYLLIKNLLGTDTARFSLIFIGFSPILLGISLIINSDSMLWIWTGLSSLSLFNFFKNQKRKFLLLSGFFLGLSVITKYVANMLLVYFFLIFFLEYLFHAYQNADIGKYLKKAFLNYLILFATAMATAFIFFPATWVKFSTLLNATILNEVFSSTWPIFAGAIIILALDIFAFKAKFSGKIFGLLAKHKHFISRSTGAAFLILAAFVLLHVYTPFKIYDIQGEIASPKGSPNSLISIDYLATYITADLFSLLFSISPLVLFFILFASLEIVRKKELDRDLTTAIYIIIFILMFYVGSTLNHVVTTVRYQIMTYPMAFLLAAIGINRFLDYASIKKYLSVWAVYSAAILILVYSLININPHFLAYASELLPKNQIVNLKGMGEGSIEAAYYLNKLPGAHEMTIWADKGAVCEAFAGKCYIDFKKKTLSENQFDYFVVSTDRKSRTLKLSKGNDFVDFGKLYAEPNPEFKEIIGGREINFVKVIKGN